MLAPVLIFLALFLVYSATVSRLAVNTDVGANVTTAWQIAQTGRPWMEGLDLREPGVVVHYAEGADGHMVTTRTPGQIWLAVPFHLGATSVQEELTWARGGIAAAFATALAMALLFLALRRRLGDRIALAATAVLALTTPVWSVSADGLWTHPVTVLGLAGAAWALDRERWWLVGLFFGLGMFARVHLAVIAAVVGLAFAWKRRSPMIAVKVGITSGACLAVLVLWNKFVFGEWSLRSGYGISAESLSTADMNLVRAYAENLAGFLVSINRGLLLWSPLLLVLIPSLRRGWRAPPDWVRYLALGGLVYTAIQLRINGFGGGDTFWGYRLALELVICVAPLLTYAALEMGPRARAWFPYVLGLQFAIIALGSIFDVLAPLVVDDDQWTRSGLVAAIQYAPAFMSASLVLLAAAGVLGARRIHVPARTQDHDMSSEVLAHPASPNADGGGTRT